MVNVALIPVRGGSKSIPLKNIKEICGKPLVYWTADAASRCNYIEKVFVMTDSIEIKNVLSKYKLNKVEIINRSAENSTDTASTESVMLEFAEKYDFDNIVLIQATSPMLTGEDLNCGFETFLRPDTDSVLSVVRQKRFCWNMDEEGIAHPINYDVYHRPRRQEFEGYLVENGAFYITTKNNLMKSRNRVSGRIRAYEMCEESFFEIDEPTDFLIIENLMKIRQKKTKKQIRMFLTDCDGCLTDGGMYYADNGVELKKFNTLDGMGLGLLKKKGIIVGIISGENTPIVKARAKKLLLDEVHLGIKDKQEVIRKLANKYKISLDEIAYVGDDINDIEALRIVGLPCSVENALAQVKKEVQYVSRRKGGEGAIREIIEYIIGTDYQE